MPGHQRVTPEILTLEMKEGAGRGKPGKRRDPTAQTPGRDFCFAGTQALRESSLAPIPAERQEREEARAQVSGNLI